MVCQWVTRLVAWRISPNGEVRHAARRAAGLFRSESDACRCGGNESWIRAWSAGSRAWRPPGRTGHATARGGQGAFDQLLLLVAAQPAQGLWVTAPRRVDRLANQASSTTSVPSQRITARWITFCSSRTLPGQAYDVSRSMVL